MYLTLSDTCAVAGLSREQVQTACERGYIKPENAGGGRGHHRRFAPMDAVGLAVAARLRAGRWGAWTYLGNVAAAFARLPERVLLQHFAQGRRYFVAVHGDSVLLGEKTSPEQVNVRDVYYAVKKKIDQLSREPANRMGRNRGLVTR